MGEHTDPDEDDALKLGLGRCCVSWVVSQMSSPYCSLSICSRASRPFRLNSSLDVAKGRARGESFTRSRGNCFSPPEGGRGAHVDSGELGLIGDGVAIMRIFFSC